MTAVEAPPDVHLAGARADGALWTVCGRLVIGPPDYLGSVSSTDVRERCDDDSVTCLACLRRKDG